MLGTSRLFFKLQNIITYLFFISVFSASSNKSIYVICIENGNFQTILRLKGHFRMVSALDADQRHVLSGSVDKTVRLWSVQKNKEGWSHKQEAILRGHFIKVKKSILFSIKDL